jgi:hypothetical protein
MDACAYPNLFDELFEKWLQEKTEFCCWYDFEEKLSKKGLDESEILSKWSVLQEEFDEEIFKKIPTPRMSSDDLSNYILKNSIHEVFKTYLRKIYNFDNTQEFVDKFIQDGLTDDEVKEKYKKIQKEFIDIINKLI